MKRFQNYLEKFPKLRGNIEEVEKVVLETIHGSFENIDRPNFSR
jgi:hypothetical protein